MSENVDALVLKYKKTRYLRKVSDTVLEQRLQTIANNLWSTDYDGNVIATRNPDHRKVLLALYCDTLFEQQIRKPKDIIFDEGLLRAQTSAEYAKPKLKSPTTFAPQCLAKFGKREHIALSMKKGRLRIAPASTYNDPSLNAAQMDEELLHNVRTPNEHIKIKLYGKDPLDGSEFEFPPQWGELFRYMQVSNFYVWCCGLGYDARLFKEFEADSALIITDQEKFANRLSIAVAQKVPSAKFQHGGIIYYDPHTTQRDQLIPAFSKNFNYLYQNEYRFVWWMPQDQTLDSFFVELGSIEDIAHIVELE